MSSNNGGPYGFGFAEFTSEGHVQIYDSYLERLGGDDDKSSGFPTFIPGGARTMDSIRHVTAGSIRASSKGDLYFQLGWEDVGKARGYHSLTLKDVMPGGDWADEWNDFLRAIGQHLDSEDLSD
jgi:hypothetical protein